MENILQIAKKEDGAFIDCNVVSSFSFVIQSIESMERIKENDGSNSHKIQQHHCPK